MHPLVIINALSKGAPLTCASCPFFHEGNGYCGKLECGGPGAGKDFPLYAGPIPRESFIDRCLVCGDGSPTHIIIGLPTKFGLCQKHRRVYDYVGQADYNKMKHPVNVIEIPK